MKAAGYVRLSQDDTTNKSDSPVHQEKIIRDYAKQNGDEIIKIYSDINRTGSNTERPGFKKMIKDSVQGYFKTIYIKDCSRLSRSIVDFETTIKWLQKYEINVISCDGIQDSKARQVVTLGNQWFAEECKKKTQQIHELKLKEQVPLNRPPYGYKMSKRLKMFVIDPEKAEDVKKMFEMKAYGSKNQEIAEEFRLSLPAVANILKNKTYLGYNKYKREWIKGKHEAIIDDSTYCKINCH